jgi:hypothetical protein
MPGIGQTRPESRKQDRPRVWPLEAVLKVPEGDSFDPETIAILRTALEDAWTNLSSEQQGAIGKGTLATRILRLAAEGERDPIRLRAHAVMGAAAE